MNFFDFVLIAIALAMDAFAVSVSGGIMSNKPGWKRICKMAGFFGFFQFMMPVLGYLLGKGVSTYIESIDHWVAFGLLAFIGIKLIIESVKGDDDNKAANDPFGTKTLFIMAIATSIDALAVGISFAIADVNVWVASVTIGVITFALSVIGVLIGKKVGSIFQKSAGIFAGIILVGIGVKILIEHMVG